MKFYICLIALLMVAASSLVYAQVPYSDGNEPQSFRSISLGGVINDDLDLVYDPIELRFVDSLHLYTNLSNLSNYNERVFSPYSGTDEYLFGVSRKCLWMDNHWISFLVRFDKSKSISETSTDNTELQDWTFPYGGAYTFRHTYSDKTQYANRPDSYQFQLNNSFLFNDLTVGLRLALGNSGTERLQSSHSYYPPESFGPFYGFGYGHSSFDHTDESYYIDSAYAFNKWDEHGKFNNKYDNPYFFANASAMKPMWGYEFRGDVMFETFDGKESANDVYTATWNNYNPRITNYSNMQSINENYKSNWEQNGSRFGIGVAVRKTFDKQAERRNDGFYSLGVAAMFGSFDYKSTGSQSELTTKRYFDAAGGGFDYQDVHNNNFADNDKGDGSENAFAINAKVNVPLIDGVYFGLGASYSYFSYERNTKFDYGINNGETYQALNTVGNPSSTTTYTTTASYKANRTYKYTDGTYRLPVGIEYKFTENKRWALRFGTIFYYDNFTYDDQQTITESKPYTQTTVYNDGTSSTYIYSDYYQSQKHHNEYGSSWKNFYYGLGFNATDNLQIDMMGMFDISNTEFWNTDFIRNLRLSFTLKM